MYFTCRFPVYLNNDLHVFTFLFQALQSGSSPSKSSLDGLDPKTADLQQRAQTLLEKR